MRQSIFSKGASLPRGTFALMFESQQAEPPAAPPAEPPAEPPKEPEISEDTLFESMADDAMFEALNKAAEFNARSDAAAAVAQWVEDGDAEADAFEALAFGLAGGEDDEELTDEQASDFAANMELMIDFCLQLGASEADCQGLADGDDDKAEAVYAAIESALQDADEDELIADFGIRENLILEAKKKVIRNGKVVTINTNKRKRRMTGAQKQALKKARQKAHSSAAKAKRRKAHKMRQSRGM